VIDYSNLLFDPVYGELGVPALFVAAGSAGEAAITVIDDTRPKALLAGSAEVRSVGPGAFARIPELTGNGIARADYVDATLSFNGRAWTVRSYELRGSPNGEDLGEVRFLLKEAAVVPPPDGNVPDWVPENAVIHIDLVGGSPQGRAWTLADGEVAVDTLLGSDANAEAWWGGPTLYSAAKLTADGYVCGAVGEAVSLIGAARTLMNAAGTMRVQHKQAVAASSTTIVFVSADGNNAIEINTFQNDAAVEASGGSMSVSIPDAMTLGAGAVNATAFTITADRFDLAASGSTAATSALDAIDRPPGNPLVAWIVDFAMRGIQSITIYDPLPDTGGLSELSEIDG
jgi:hypothetical protein